MFPCGEVHRSVAGRAVGFAAAGGGIYAVAGDTGHVFLAKVNEMMILISELRRMQFLQYFPCSFLERADYQKCRVDKS